VNTVNVEPEVNPNAAFIEDDADAVRQDNPLRLPVTPTGFYSVKDAVGHSLGMGFYCPRCKLHYPANAPHEIKHCGKVTLFPKNPTDGGNLFKWLKFFLFENKTMVIQKRYY